MKKSFTLVELLVVIAVFTILSIISILNFRGGGMGSSLKRDSAKMALNLREIEEMTIAGKEYGPSSICNNCYGAEFTEDGNYYTLFADLNMNYEYDGGDEYIEEIYFEGKNKIKERPFYVNSSGSTSTVPILTVVFYPPNPTVVINQEVDNIEAGIIIENTSNGNLRGIRINRAGLINDYDL